MTLLSSQCIVIKIGSSLLVNETNNSLNIVWLNSLIEDVVLISSGTIIGHIKKYATNHTEAIITNCEIAAKQF